MAHSCYNEMRKSMLYKILPTTYYLLPTRRAGQSLMEVLIGVAIGSLIIIAAVTVIASVLKGSADVQRVQAGAALGKELAEQVRVWAENDWHNVSNLATSSLNHYYLVALSSPFVVAAGDEMILVATTTYTRYFYVDDVSRDAGGAILASGGSNDPSTKKISVVYQWPRSSTNAILFYVTRSRSAILRQTDWSGGAGQGGPATITNNFYASSSNVNVTTSTGSLFINL